ncbi:MAG: hypothetical protein OEV38_16655 [Nitrospira sp.]|nr:hypothetical protein [Nitrospira sp.]MDH4357831.1 hypothetical protein [Nitrospira sp.]MDH5320323.1 hypothetical protein [Nitrospira sp.]
MIVRSVGLIILFVGAFELACPSLSSATSSRTQSGHDNGRFALQYVEALTHSQIATWAAADLGCLSRARAGAGGGSPKLTPDVAQRCWDDTLNSHTAMVSQQTEAGVFNATGQGVGLGLLHNRHRATENWKEYPPTVFVSPPIVLKDYAPIPQIRACQVFCVTDYCG